MPKPGQLTAMISSTALDLPEHRAQVFDACIREGVFPIGMDHLPARNASGIQVSLDMVDQADIYIGIYAWRYGWVPDIDNPGKISITEMEFNRALERQQSGKLKEILIFLMHDDHPIRASDKEDGKEAQRKLKAFKKRASIGRSMLQFESKEKLQSQVIQSLADLKRRLEQDPTATDLVQSIEETTVPTPPDFYAEPDYIGSHQFVGRARELEELSDWAKPADPTNLLLLEAIGGNGKSMLTWEWTTKNATTVRADWAGRFWYSFYEKGAVMAEFCRRALAYMTEKPLEEFSQKKTPELAKDLLAQLHARPWLLILDGLERVLVAYHRIDAAEVPDEEANDPTDKIANRNPTDAIRDEDNDLLRALAAAAPSKILVSSRLTPRVLLNPSGQPISGAKRITLPGLRPPDAEKLLRSFGIVGDSAAIQSYLTANCDNHPLVIAVLGGLINQPGSNRGDFDAWVANPHAGAALDLGRLDLIQRRNHILRAALDALSPESRQLLSTLALISDSVDYETLKAFNPHLPPEPVVVEKPEPPEEEWSWIWDELSDEQKADRKKEYEDAIVLWQDYERSMQAWLASADFRAAPKKLEATVTDLEQRGLLQWDGRELKYNLHPVVRGVASVGMAAADRERHGQRVLDRFSAQPHRPYEEAEAMEDVRSGLHVVRTLLKLGRFHQAANAYRGDLANALLFNLEAYTEALSLLRAFFPAGWGELPKEVTATDGAYLANNAAIALLSSGQRNAAIAAQNAALRIDLAEENWRGAAAALRNIARSLSDQNRLSQALRVDALALEVAMASDDEEGIFVSRLRLFDDQSRLGLWAAAAANWRLLDPMGRAWSRAAYRPGVAEYSSAQFHFWQGTMKEERLAEVKRLATEGKDRGLVRSLHRLRGTWQLEQGEWALAAASYQEAVRLTRERGLRDATSETGLALAKHHLGQLADPRQEAKRLAELRDPAHNLLAQLWLALGDSERAKRHALAAYRWSWADGEPYVNRYELTKSTELLQQMKVDIPALPPYDPTQDEMHPWENGVQATIASLGLTEQALVDRWLNFLEGTRAYRPQQELRPGFPRLRVVSCRLRNIAVFKDTGTLVIARDGTLLLGDNATGKSTILKCIALASIGLDNANSYWTPQYLRNGALQGYIEVVFELQASPSYEPKIDGRFAVGLRVDRGIDFFSAPPGNEMTLNGRGDLNNCLERLSRLRNQSYYHFGFICAFGPGRNFNSDSRAPENTPSIDEIDWIYSLFQRQSLFLNPDVLMRLIHGDTRNFQSAPDALESDLSLAIRAGVNRLLPEAEIAPSNMGFDLTLRGEEISIRTLSDGYSSIITIVGHIIRAALRLTTWQQNPFLVSGILLIDELEIHLHPAWQAHVFSDLRRVFPNLQIIASTHSPLVAGALDTSSVLLLKAEGGKTSVVPLQAVLKETQSMKAWRADQIQTGPAFNMETSISIEAQEWEDEFAQLCGIPNKNLSREQRLRLIELREKLDAEIPRTAESPIAREAANLFEEWASSRLNQRPPEEVIAILDEVKKRLSVG